MTGEESIRQVALRARRIEVAAEQVRLLAETRVETILDAIEREPPRIVVIDSIQTMFTDALQSAPGSVAQVRESAARFVRHAKAHAVSVLLVGHVTKDGTLAGPRVLEHMVDTVLYFESEADRRFRIIRAVKNRFGAVNEIGLFAMTDKGLREVRNPSAIFLARGDGDVAGSVVTVVREGTRPLLVEVQALVDEVSGPPRRLTVGIDQGRLNMLLAVRHRMPVISPRVWMIRERRRAGSGSRHEARTSRSLTAVRSTLSSRPWSAVSWCSRSGARGRASPRPRRESGCWKPHRRFEGGWCRSQPSRAACRTRSMSLRRPRRARARCRLNATAVAPRAANRSAPLHQTASSAEAGRTGPAGMCPQGSESSPPRGGRAVNRPMPRARLPPRTDKSCAASFPARASCASLQDAACPSQPRAFTQETVSGHLARLQGSRHGSRRPGERYVRAFACVLRSKGLIRAVRTALPVVCMISIG